LKGGRRDPIVSALLAIKLSHFSFYYQKFSSN